MAQALAAVRADLGHDAVILHTRSFRAGGFLGIGQRTVVEITAARGQDVGRRRAGRGRSRQSAGAMRNTAQRERVAAGTTGMRSTQDDQQRIANLRRQAEELKDQAGAVAVDESASQASTAVGDLIRRTYAIASSEAEARLKSQSQPAQPCKTSSQTSGHSQITDGSTQPKLRVDHVNGQNAIANHEQLVKEMSAVKEMVCRVMKQQQKLPPMVTRSGADLEDPLFDQYLALIEQEVADEIAHEVMLEVRNRVGNPAEANAKKVASVTRAVMTERMPGMAGPQADLNYQKPDDGRPLTIAFVGPTGVGKTTTVAKLAAQYKLKQGLNVALITLDTYRIAAVEQLRTYANIIGLPLHVVSKAEEMSRAMQLCQGCDVVLIDTAGRSQRDTEKLTALKDLLASAEPHEVHLVLSSAASARVLNEAVAKFSEIRTDRVVFTKLDEAVTFGMIFNVTAQLGKKLSYVTTGQEVPHHIEPGNAGRLASLIMDGSLNA